MMQAVSRRIATLVAVATLVWAGEVSAQVGHPLYSCADQLVRHVREYIEDVTHDLAACELNRISSQNLSTECLTNSTVIAKLANSNQELELEVRESSPETNPDDRNDRCWGEEDGRDEGRALCPLESRNVDLFLDRVMGGTCQPSDEEGLPPQVCSNERQRACDDDADCLPGTLRGRAYELVKDVFRTEYAGCSRPAVKVSNGAKDCAVETATLAENKTGETNQCFFSCEKVNLASSDACVDEDDGEPAANDVIDCIEQKTGVDQDMEAIVNECSDAEVRSLGCPLGADTAADLAAALGERLAAQAQEINLEMFHSSCRTQLPGVVIPTVPADVTLEPSLTRKQVSCGQVLDAAFFGSDRKLSFDTDLSCVNVDAATNGIVVARNGVTINGRSQTRSITGPGRRALRTGAGVLVAPGVRRVTITGFRKIQSFGIGVADSGDNQGIKVLRSTFFRNIEAGVRSSSRRTRISEVTADRNGVGLALSGDGSLVTSSRIIRSEPQSISSQAPLSSGFGIVLGGADTDGNGRTVRVANNPEIDENVVGIVVDGEKHLLVGNVVRGNVGRPRAQPPVAGDGILVLDTSSGSVFDSNSIKANAANGMTVIGSANRLEANRTEENLQNGFLILGSDNLLEGNNAGAPHNDPNASRLGNALAGYVVGGTGNQLDTNVAEGNAGTGFEIEGPTAAFKGNTSSGNDGLGFDVTSSGNVLDSNKAEQNGASEYVIAADNVDDGGNKKNGTSFSFTATGGTFE